MAALATLCAALCAALAPMMVTARVRVATSLSLFVVPVSLLSMPMLGFGASSPSAAFGAFAVTSLVAVALTSTGIAGAVATGSDILRAGFWVRGLSTSRVGRRVTLCRGGCIATFRHDCAEVETNVVVNE